MANQEMERIADLEAQVTRLQDAVRYLASWVSDMEGGFPTWDDAQTERELDALQDGDMAPVSASQPEGA